MIENAKLEDKEEIYNLICILENKEINKEHFDCVFENSLKDEDIIFLVYRDKKIEGFLSFKIHHYLHHDHDTGEIVEPVVLPEKRNLKIGKQLIEKIEEIARNKNNCCYRLHAVYSKALSAALVFNFGKAQLSVKI